MIERYSREPMRSIFSDENRFKAYLEVELFATEAWSKLGVVPENDVKKLFENAGFIDVKVHIKEDDNWICIEGHK